MTEYLSQLEWEAEGEKRFGKDRLNWRFVCPSCGHVASVNDWKEAGASSASAAFSCVGRWTGATGEATFRNAGGPCNYAGGGLFRINPTTVHTDDGPHQIFDFAEPMTEPLP